MRRFDCSSLYQREDIAISLTSPMPYGHRDFLRDKWRGAFVIIIYIVVVILMGSIVVIIYHEKYYCSFDKGRATC